jgi:hypothetical protein
MRVSGGAFRGSRSPFPHQSATAGGCSFWISIQKAAPMGIARDSERQRKQFGISFPKWQEKHICLKIKVNRSIDFDRSNRLPLS